MHRFRRFYGAMLMAMAAAQFCAVTASHASGKPDVRSDIMALQQQCQVQAWQADVRLDQGRLVVIRSPTLSQKQNACIDAFIMRRMKSVP